MKLISLALIALSLAPAQASYLQGRVEQDDRNTPKIRGLSAEKLERSLSATVKKQATLNGQVALNGQGALGIIWDWDTGYVNFIDPISTVRCSYGDKILAINGVPANQACRSGICLGPVGSFAQVTVLHNGVVYRETARRQPIASLQPVWHLMNGEPVENPSKAMNSLNLYYLNYLPIPPPEARQWSIPPRQ